MLLRYSLSYNTIVDYFPITACLFYTAIKILFKYLRFEWMTWSVCNLVYSPTDISSSRSWFWALKNMHSFIFWHCCHHTMFFFSLLSHFCFIPQQLYHQARSAARSVCPWPALWWLCRFCSRGPADAKTRPLSHMRTFTRFNTPVTLSHYMRIRLARFPNKRMHKEKKHYKNLHQPTCIWIWIGKDDGQISQLELNCV